MININTSEANKQLKSLERGLAKFEVERAQARAMNRTILAVRTASSKEIRKKYRIRAQNIKATMSKRNATPSNQEASLTSTGAPMPLMAFNPRITKKGVTARIRNISQRFPGAFKARMKSGHVGIFARAEYKNNRLKSRRTRHRPSDQNDLGITEVRTLAIPSALANETVSGNLQALIRERYPRTLESELKFRKLKAAGMIPR